MNKSPKNKVSKKNNQLTKGNYTLEKYFQVIKKVTNFPTIFAYKEKKEQENKIIKDSEKFTSILFSKRNPYINSEEKEEVDYHYSDKKFSFLLRKRKLNTFNDGEEKDMINKKKEDKKNIENICYDDIKSIELNEMNEEGKYEEKNIEYTEEEEGIIDDKLSFKSNKRDEHKETNNTLQIKTSNSPPILEKKLAQKISEIYQKDKRENLISSKGEIEPNKIGAQNSILQSNNAENKGKKNYQRKKRKAWYLINTGLTGDNYSLKDIIKIIESKRINNDNNIPNLSNSLVKSENKHDMWSLGSRKAFIIKLPGYYRDNYGDIKKIIDNILRNKPKLFLFGLYLYQNPKNPNNREDNSDTYILIKFRVSDKISKNLFNRFKNYQLIKSDYRLYNFDIIRSGMLKYEDNGHPLCVYAKEIYGINVTQTEIKEDKGYIAKFIRDYKDRNDIQDKDLNKNNENPPNNNIIKKSNDDNVSDNDDNKNTIKDDDNDMLIDNDNKNNINSDAGSKVNIDSKSSKISEDKK